MIIGISGYARSGKDTIANYLVDKYGFEKRSFATKLKEAVTALNPIIDYVLEDGELLHLQDAWNPSLTDQENYERLKANYPEIRNLWQNMGTEVGRNKFGENFWVDLTLGDITPDQRVVLADTRFPNEAREILSLGGEVWRVHRPGVNAANSHSSETSLDDWNFDRIIFNDGPLEALYGRVDAVMKFGMLLRPVETT